MTLLVFLAVLASLLLLRLIPGLVLRMVLAIPRRRIFALLHRLPARRIAIAFAGRRQNALPEWSAMAAPRPAFRRVKLVLVSSSLIFLAVLVTTAYWSWHATALMVVLR